MGIWKVLLNDGMSFSGIRDFGLCIFLCFPVAARGDPAQEPAGHRIFFSASGTRVPVGDTRMIAVQVDPPPMEDLLLPATGDRAGVLEILQVPEILAGHSMGFMRVRGLKTGSTTILTGHAQLDVTVYRHRRIDPPANEFPVILSPPNGAFLWGDVTAAVEVFRDPISSAGTIAPVVLEALGTRVFEAAGESPPGEGPFVRTTFSITESLLPPGSATFIARAGVADGGSIDSHPLLVEVGQVRKPEVNVEAELYSTTPRPESLRYRKDPSVVIHPEASRNKCVAIRDESQALTIECDLKINGQYQVMARVRGEAGGAAYPTLGLLVNDEEDPTAVARIFGSRWHRIPMGRPFPLRAGVNRLTFVFLNEFEVPELSDRNLYIDTIELARVRTLVPLRDFPETAASREMGMGAAMNSDNAEMIPGYGPGPLRIGLRNVIHGRKVAGTFQVEARVWWNRIAEERPPRVYLLLNGESVTQIRAVAPVFTIRKSQLAAGANSVQLQAVADNGDSVFTPVQTVWLESDRPPPAPGGAGHLFTVWDKRWISGMSGLIRKTGQGTWLDSVLLRDGSQCVLLLPDELEGDYELAVDSSGNKDNMIELLITLKSPGKIQSKKFDPPLPSGGLIPVGRVAVRRGRAEIHLAASRTERWNGEEEASCEFRSILLTPVYRERDALPPEVVVLYPPADHRVSGADAVVAWIQDETNLQSVDLIVDDEPQFLDVIPENQLGLLVLPVLARSLKPGRHEFQVRAWDDSGNHQVSAPQSFVVEPVESTRRGKYQRAIRLLNRFGYGPEPRALAAILTQGEKSWLTSSLQSSFRSPDERTLNAYLLAAYPDSGSRSHIEHRVIEQLMRTDNPARMRFVMWLENHFSTWIQKIGPASKWDEHVRFCIRGASPFPELLYASATSPAMLYYLDQNRSFRGQINENYAREIMELHTLGVDGGYSQTDVTELAKLLTGWTVADEADPARPGHSLVRTFRFDPNLNHGEERIVVGKRFGPAPQENRFDRIRQALEVLSAHPSTASFVCGKLIEHYVQVPAQETMREDLAEVFTASGGDMVAVMAAMAARHEFWDDELPAKFTTPLDFGVHLARISSSADPSELNRFLGLSGMLLFGCPTPDGYPEAPGEYADTNAFLQRWNHSQAGQKGLASVIPNSWRNERRFQSRLEQQRLIDLAAIRMTGTLLGKRSNEAALLAVSAATGSPDERAEQLAALIGYLPEMHLR
jgi:hypothetical protein